METIETVAPDAEKAAKRATESAGAKVPDADTDMAGPAADIGPAKVTSSANVPVVVIMAVIGVAGAFWAPVTCGSSC